MNAPLVTILIPNYKTPDLTKICFRLLNRFTTPGLARFIAIDNDSRDESLDYLRSLEWIELMERHELEGESGPVMHARALDLAFAQVTTEFVLVMHTDTFVTNPGWLEYLLSKIQADEKIGGVGSWKLEHVSAFKTFMKKIEDDLHLLFGKKRHADDRYLRSHCAIYRTELVRRFTNGFNDGHTAGLSLHKMLEARGNPMIFLNPDELGKYLCHLNHATGILNPAANSRRDGTAKSGRRIQKALELFRQVLSDSSLDTRKK